MQLDRTEHPDEDTLMALMPTQAIGTIKDARAAGIAWSAIFALMLQYGPQLADIIKRIIDAINTPPAPPAS